MKPLLLPALLTLPAIACAHGPSCRTFAQTMFYGHEAPADRAYFGALARAAGDAHPDLARLYWRCTETPGVPFRQMVRERLWVQRDMRSGE